MAIRFWTDPETGRPHVEAHGVTRDEVHDVLDRPLEDRPGRDSSRVALGKTRGGRYLRVIYVQRSLEGSIFVVTAYDLGRRAVWALRRRLRKRR